MKKVVKLSQWGNSRAIRMPMAMLKDMKADELQTKFNLAYDKNKQTITLTKINK